jgi:hypothetical protein
MRTYNIYIILMAMLLLLNIKYSKAQLPSSDPAYTLVWADSFNTTGVQIDTSKWGQRWRWNQADSVAYDGNGNPYDRAFDKWHLTSGHPAGDYYIDTIDCKKNGGNLNLYTRKETFSGECWQGNRV